MPNESPNNSLLQTVTNMINNIANEGNGYDTLINVLSLLCLLLILNRTQPSMSAPLPQSISPTTSTNPLQKILGELTKNTDGSNGGPSPDMLMSLLPLLNNPQVKSKLNPTNISSILGMLGNLGGGSNNDKSEVTKTDKPEKKEPPAAAVTSSLAEHSTPVNVSHSDEQDNKDLGRSLNWKSNFQNEKEV
ncbi:MAG: hypothetical protein H6Q68_3900 [Firmicutes bacterium]|nr:hypothetical protein [Bacillota bacterium]